MKKRVLFGLVAMILVVAMIFAVGCNSSNPSNTEYWFSSTSKEFVPYDEAEDNLSEAGNYWYFTSARDTEVTMNVIINVSGYFSTAYLYVNDVQVQSETDTGIFTFVYKLNLKKGDKIKIHAFWVNSLIANETGFDLQYISMKTDDGTYVLNEYNNIQ